MEKSSQPQSKPQSKAVGIIIGLLLLAAVGYLDYITGYKITVLVFYLIPILFVLRRVGLSFAFIMAVMSAVVWLVSDIAAGDQYPDLFTPAWNLVVRMSIFLQVVILASARDGLKIQVRQRTAKLQNEIERRISLEKELLDAGEREQRRIGHDLHDSLGQQLTATALAAKVLAKKLNEKSLPDAAAADQVVTMVEDSIELTRKLARSLHPIELESLQIYRDLRRALLHHCQGSSGGWSPCKCIETCGMPSCVI